MSVLARDVVFTNVPSINPQLASNFDERFHNLIEKSNVCISRYQRLDNRLQLASAIAQESRCHTGSAPNVHDILNKLMTATSQTEMVDMVTSMRVVKG